MGLVYGSTFKGDEILFFDTSVLRLLKAIGSGFGITYGRVRSR